MIGMLLSRFGLKESADLQRFRRNYAAFAQNMRARRPIAGSDPLGRRRQS